MTKKRKPSKPLAGSPSLKVDLDPLGEDASTYILVGEARIQGQGTNHEDLLRRVGHFLNHPTATRLMTVCGITAFAFKAGGWALVDKERGRVVQETHRSALINPHTGKPIGEQ